MPPGLYGPEELYFFAALLILWFPPVAAETLQSRLDRALAAAQKGDCAGAVGDLNAVVRTEPQLVPALNALAVCESLLGHPERATARFEQITRLEPGAWQAWNNLGANYLALEQPTRAVPAFLEAIRLAPNMPSPRFNLGNALLKLDRIQEAFDALDHAQRLAPQDNQLLSVWLETSGRLATEAAEAIEKQQYQKAKALLELVRRPLENSPSWNNLIGYAEFKLENPEPALKHLQKALELEPGNEDFLLDIGELLAHYRANKEATDLFEVAARRMPRSRRVQFGLAISYILQNRRDEATRLLESLIASDHPFEPAYRALGECYEDAGNSAALVALGKQLQVMDDRSPLGWYLEGAGLLRIAIGKQGTVEQAIAALRRSLLLDPNSSRTHFTLAKAYQQDQKIELAVAELQETLRLEPQHERAHYVLARLFQKLGKADLASQEMKAHSQIKEQDRAAQYRRLVITSRSR